MTALRFILGDQLSRSISSLDDIDAARDVVLMVEVREEATYVPHHQQKLVLVLSAMRHFARSLGREGVQLDYVHLDEEGNSGSFTGELRRALERHGCDRIIVTEPSEWRVHEMMQRWSTECGAPVEVRPDNRFLCSLDDFRDWSQGRKSLRMEYFYRTMRRRWGWLMKDGQPLGGRWNYDSENRKPLPRGSVPPRRLRFDPDPLTREVMQLVEREFPDHFGELSSFAWAVTRAEALEALAHFVEEGLPAFGDYQDAMKKGDDFLFHALLSPYLNLGLLEPREVCEAALAALERGAAPLAAVEGFVRQILGWREYVRGLYWLKMPEYANTNYLDAKRPLPDFFWTAETGMKCLREAIAATRQNAYAHHIQRLMVTGNFALLAGLSPPEVEAWYLLVYADAFEWVELPNTHGMALFADGGILASKPYAASGSYINRMSDYCRECSYDPGEKLGETACPLNFLYWDFLLRNEKRLRGNARMGLAYRNVDRMDGQMQRQLQEQASAFLDGLAGR
jgi:deoxyribodipyrimidine photolyase-related protein